MLKTKLYSLIFLLIIASSLNAMEECAMENLALDHHDTAREIQCMLVELQQTANELLSIVEVQSHESTEGLPHMFPTSIELACDDQECIIQASSQPDTQLTKKRKISSESLH